MTDVLVVGAGPAGLVAGITLACHGVDVLVVDKREEISTLARALVISTRSMEIFRSWGLEHDIRAGAADVEPLAWVTPTLASGVGTAMPLGYPTAAQAAKVSPTGPAWAPQDHLEPLLLGLLRTASTARVRFGCELVELSQDAAAVHAVLSEEGGTRTVDASYLIGADGAHSAVRAALGVAMDGPDDLDEYHRVEFDADLSAAVEERRYGLNVITHPDAGGVMARRGRGDRWGYSREWKPGQPRLVDAAPDAQRALIATAVGIDDVMMRIERSSAFSFAAQLADRYRARRGFLIGDAAHRMTPRGGTGMNTAIQDGFDLGWKLAWVHRGWAASELLDSYEAERRRVGAHNVGRAGDAGGARREAGDALPWDLDGRLPHHWIGDGLRPLSTLDLLGEGLTLLTGPDEPGWQATATGLGTSAPVTVRALDHDTAVALDVRPRGAVLLRPDGKQLARWPALGAAPELDPLPGVALAR